jgi:hypothetical protein
MKYPVLVASVIFIFACGEKKTVPAVSLPLKQDSAAASAKYFPVMNFIKGQIAYVDSLPVGIKKYIVGTKKGYVYIKPKEFHQLAAEFIPAEISDDLFTKEYQETSFLDQSSNSATFFYTTKNASLPVKRVDILTMKGDVYDQVKSIYLQKNYRSGDTAFTKKLYWKPQRSFQIITEVSAGSKKPVTEIVNVVWDNMED